MAALKLRRVGALLLASVMVISGCSNSDSESGGGPPVGDPATTTAPPSPSTGPAPESPPARAETPSGEAKVVVSPRGVVLPVKGREGGGYRVATPCANTAVVRGATPITAAPVVLDVGHGGDEEGAKGPNGLSEKVVNLAVAGYARAALQRQGTPAVLTRTGDYRMTLGARAEVALALRPRAYVSIHHNSVPDGPRAGPGTETYYQLGSAGSKRLAGLIYEEVVNALSNYRVPWVADRDAGAKYRPNSRGGDYYAILRQAGSVTAVLAELAFISNPPEADLLARADVQQVEGEAVARGILRFLNSDAPGSGYVTPYPRDEPAGPGGGSSGCVDPPL